MRHRPTKLWSHIWVIVAIVKYCSYGVLFSNAKILLRKRRFLHLIVLTVVKNGSSEAPTSSAFVDFGCCCLSITIAGMQAQISHES